KVFSDDNAAHVSISLSCDSRTVSNSPQNASDETTIGGAPALFTVTGYTGDPTCTATETVPAGYTASGTPTGTCQATLTSAGTCTITNTATSASFTVHKVFSDDNAADVSISLSCDSGTVSNSPQNASDETTIGGAPALFTVTGYTGDPTCTTTETVPAGYTASGTPTG